MKPVRKKGKDLLGELLYFFHANVLSPLETHTQMVVKIN